MVRPPAFWAICCGITSARGQGFKHAASGKTADQKATEQALYAMAAYERYCRRTKALYDMTDAVCAHSFGDWQVVSPATCTADGSRQRVCTRCGRWRSRRFLPQATSSVSGRPPKNPPAPRPARRSEPAPSAPRRRPASLLRWAHTPRHRGVRGQEYHWNICEVCDEAVNKTEHTYVNGIQCVCGVRKSAERRGYHHKACGGVRRDHVDAGRQ